MATGDERPGETPGMSAGSTACRHRASSLPDQNSMSADSPPTAERRKAAFQVTLSWVPLLERDGKSPAILGRSTRLYLPPARDLRSCSCLMFPKLKVRRVGSTRAPSSCDAWDWGREPPTRIIAVLRKGVFGSSSCRSTPPILPTSAGAHARATVSPVRPLSACSWQATNTAFAWLLPGGFPPSLFACVHCRGGTPRRPGRHRFVRIADAHPTTRVGGSWGCFQRGEPSTRDGGLRDRHHRWAADAYRGVHVGGTLFPRGNPCATAGRPSWGPTDRWDTASVCTTKLRSEHRHVRCHAAPLRHVSASRSCLAGSSRRRALLL